MCKFAFWISARPRDDARRRAPAALLGGMLLASGAPAVELSDTVQLHGFASQAYIDTTANKYFGNSENGTFDFRELGINMSWQALPRVQFAAQVGSRKAGGTEVNADPRFDYLLADVTALSGDAGRAGVRIGRHRNALGFYNQTRDVANTRPSIFLPESVYTDASRSNLLALDGVQFYSESRTGVGDFFLDLGAGNIIFDSIAKQVGKSETSYVGRLLYEADGGRVRLALSGINANLVAYQAPFPNAQVLLDAYLLSAQYNEEKWSLTGEWMPESKSAALGVAGLGDIRQTGESYYLQGTYRFLPEWEALLRYDVLYFDKSDKTGEKYASSIFGLLGGTAYSRFAKDQTIGVGWNIRPDTRLRAEYHRVNGTGWLSARENPVPGNTKQYWDLFALQLSFNF